MGYDNLTDNHGFDSVETFVCGNCVGDQILARLVADNLESDSCSYCNSHSHGMIAAPFATVMEHIYDAVLRYYADAQDLHIPWDEGWISPEVEPTDILGKFDPGWSDELFSNILHCLEEEDKYWVAHSQHDWSLANPTEALTYGWRAFTDTALHKTRYLFLSEPIDEIDISRSDYIPVQAVLDTLGALVTNLNLVTRLDCGTVCYRARVPKEGQSCKEFSEVSVPPRDFASAGRMNPAGIPYFYIALDRETAKRETVSKPQRSYALATLKTKTSLLLLNLADLPDLPSIFESEKYNERHELEFLYAFREEICKPISKDGKEHIEYIPTQIISEFFRHRFTYNKKKLDGIIFNSSKTKDGKNVTLFVSDHKEVEKIMDLMDLAMMGARRSSWRTYLLAVLVAAVVVALLWCIPPLMVEQVMGRLDKPVRTALQTLKMHTAEPSPRFWAGAGWRLGCI